MMPMKFERWIETLRVALLRAGALPAARRGPGLMTGIDSDLNR
jgi:hypothetical protein